jgi:hypothetical protein
LLDTKLTMEVKFFIKLVLVPNSNHDKLFKKSRLNKSEILITSNNSSLLKKMIKENFGIMPIYDYSLKDHPEILNGELKMIPIA